MLEVKKNKQIEFLKLRSEGKTYKEIANQLNVHPNTITNWSKELKEEIQNQDKEEYEELYCMYHMDRKARIQSYGELLKKIDTEIDKREMSEISLDRLLDYKLKYMNRLNALYLPYESDKEIKDISINDIIKDLYNLNIKISDGTISMEQATKEKEILMSLLDYFVKEQNNSWEL